MVVRMECRENLPLHRKYRPNNLDDYIANTNTKKKVNQMLTTDKVQTIFLEGSTGSGKTTLGRILAKEYVCECGDSGRACGVCTTCKEMDEYIRSGETRHLLNVWEVDVADKNKVENVAQLIENIHTPNPYGGGWKVYIFDECHGLSKMAQDKLLKTLEEPPAGVLIIFCTTEPEKLKDTLVTRCQMYLKIEKPRTKELVGLLERVCKLENVTYDIMALSQLVKSSKNLTRVALTRLELLINQRGKITKEGVQETFDLMDSQWVEMFFRAVVGGIQGKDTLAAYMQCLFHIRAKSTFKEFHINVLDYMEQGLYALSGLATDGLTKEHVKLLRELYKGLSVRQIGDLLTTLLSWGGTQLELKYLAFGYNGFKLSEQRSAEVVTIKRDSTGDDKRVQMVLKKEEEAHQLHLSEQRLLGEMCDKPKSMEQVLTFFNATAKRVVTPD